MSFHPIRDAMKSAPSPGAGLSRSRRERGRSTPAWPPPWLLSAGDKWFACRRPRKTARHSDSERNRACNRRRPVAARAAAGRATGASHSGSNRPSSGRAEWPSPGRIRDTQPSPRPPPTPSRRRLALRLAGMAKAAYRTGATCVKRAWRGGFGQKGRSAGVFLAVGRQTPRPEPMPRSARYVRFHRVTAHIAGRHPHRNAPNPAWFYFTHARSPRKIAPFG